MYRWKSNRSNKRPKPFYIPLNKRYKPRRMVSLRFSYATYWSHTSRVPHLNRTVHAEKYLFSPLLSQVWATERGRRSGAVVIFPSQSQRLYFMRCVCTTWKWQSNRPGSGVQAVGRLHHVPLYIPTSVPTSHQRPTLSRQYGYFRSAHRLSEWFSLRQLDFLLWLIRHIWAPGETGISTIAR